MGHSNNRKAQTAINQSSRTPRIKVNNTVTKIVSVDFNKEHESEIHNNKLIEDKKKKQKHDSTPSTNDKKGTYKSKVTVNKAIVNNDEEALGISKVDICNYIEQSSNGKITNLNKDMLIEDNDNGNTDTRVCTLDDSKDKLNNILGTVKTMINTDINSISDINYLITDSLAVLNKSLNLVNDGIDRIDELQEFVEDRVFNYLGSVGVTLGDKITFGGLAKKCSGLETFSLDFSMPKLHKLALTMTLSGLLKALLCMGMEFVGDWFKSLPIFDSVMSGLMLLSSISLIAENINHTGDDTTNTTLDILELTTILYENSTEEIKNELLPIMKIALDRTLVVLNSDTKEPSIEILNKRSSIETLNLLNKINTKWSIVNNKTNITTIANNKTLGLLADRHFINTTPNINISEDTTNEFNVTDLNNLLFVNTVSNTITVTPTIGDITNFGICNTNVKQYTRINCKERLI